MCACGVYLMQLGPLRLCNCHSNRPGKAACIGCMNTTEWLVLSSLARQPLSTTRTCLFALLQVLEPPAGAGSTAGGAASAAAAAGLAVNSYSYK
jgi:hypothetical protein